MAKAFLTNIAIKGFKSSRDASNLRLAPLTILIGPNNSGKSTWIQPLRLLSQTLRQPRRDVPLSTEGWFDFLTLRDLVYGRPVDSSATSFTFELEWVSDVDVDQELDSLGKGLDLRNLASDSGIPWLVEGGTHSLCCRITITFGEQDRSIQLREVNVEIKRKGEEWNKLPRLRLRRPAGNGWEIWWGGTKAKKLEVGFDSFLPILGIDKQAVGPRLKERSIFNAWAILFRPPTDDLKKILLHFSYLGSARDLPPLLFRPASVPPEDVGPRGEYAAQVLHSRQAEKVHYLPPLDNSSNLQSLPSTIRCQSLKEAVDDIYAELGIKTEALQIEDLQEFGFRMFFGHYPVDQVGSGLWHLLPIVELGLIADPLRFSDALESDSLETYLDALDSPTQISIEEPECHLHPKVQSRLAQWYVALAMAGRRLMIETHSDHLVRKLRGMIARAEKDSPLEKWFEDNVVIAQVTQVDGLSTVVSSHLTRLGDIEDWPSDFMDEGSNEERDIYLAALEKDPPPALPVADLKDALGQ